MAASNTIFSSFGLADVAIAKYDNTLGIAASPGWLDVPGVMQAQARMSVTPVEQFGDDQRLNIFYHSQKGQVALRASQTSLYVLEILSGNLVSSSPASSESILFGTDLELQPPEVALRCRATVKDAPSGRNTLTVFFFRGVVNTAFEETMNLQFGNVTEVVWNIEILPSKRTEAGQLISSLAGFGASTYAMGRIQV